MWCCLYPSRWNVDLTTALLVSGVVHLLLVLLLPGFIANQLDTGKPYIEVSLLPPPPIRIKKYTPPPVPAKKKAKVGEWQALAPRLSIKSKSYQSRPYQPLVELPLSKVVKKDLLDILPDEAFMVDELLKMPLVEQPITPIFPQPGVGDTESTPKPTSDEITWSGSPRRYLYKPPDPSYSSKFEGEVKLKFWVDPQGNVTNAVVLRRLDAQLERLAIDYIKRWRFETLRGRWQELQWGTISIRFRWSETGKPAGNISE